MSFHGLRKTATTLLHEAGVPSAVAQALIGHDSEAMHELYISVGREAREKATAAEIDGKRFSGMNEVDGSFWAVSLKAGSASG